MRAILRPVSSSLSKLLATLLFLAAFSYYPQKQTKWACFFFGAAGQTGLGQKHPFQTPVRLREIRPRPSGRLRGTRPGDRSGER